MDITVHTIGYEQNKVVVIDDAIADPDAIIDLAASKPFPGVLTNSYPGERRHISAAIEAERAYIEDLRHRVGPVMEEVFGVSGFRIGQAAFSLITLKAHETHPLTHIPHCDSATQTKYALLHFLSPKPQGGTGFFRQRRTGIESLTPERMATFEQAVRADIDTHGLPDAYISDDTETFERIAYFESGFNRILIYSGSILHSAVLPDDFAYSRDPRQGRLTANLFLLP